MLYPLSHRRVLDSLDIIADGARFVKGENKNNFVSVFLLKVVVFR